jgi:hypothetical protein
MKRRRFQKLDTNTLVMLKHIGWGVLVIAIAALVFVAIWYGARIESLTLQHVEVTGGQTISHERVSDLALQQLNGEYVGFIPRTFAWTYPKKDIISSLATIERMHSIEVDRTNGSTLSVTFEEYLPAALWCQTLLAKECVFINDSGRAYGTSPDLAGGSMLRYIHTSQTPEIQKQLTTPEDFQLLQQLVDLLAAKEWFVSHVEIDKARDAFLHIVAGGEFKVTLTQDPQVTVNNLNVVLTSEEFQDVQPGNFQYIDLRFGNKVFVNEEDEVLEDVSTSTLDEIIVEDEAAPAPPEDDVITETAASDDAAGE